MKPEDVEMWRRALLRARERKDILFRSDNDSPIRSAEFTGLKYFDPDPEFRFETELRRNPAPGGVIMTISKGTRQLFNCIGHFELSMEGSAVRLNAYQSAEREDPSLFVPFRDATSGEESYAAARYLDLEVEHDDMYAIDFNYAYNPYCTYSDAYVCPLPPRENWLTVAIRAGEKKYHD
jgi:hypothetical protein